MSSQIVKINSFKLNNFRSLLVQSLIVNKQLMLEFSDNFIRSASYTSQRSCLKMWICPTEKLIDQGTTPPEKINIPTFDMFVLRGDLFFNSLSVFISDNVDLEFTLVPSTSNKDRLVASSLRITGTTESKNVLNVEFNMSTEETISDKISDYASVIERFTVSEKMHSFVLSEIQTQEIKRLIKKLHKTNSENTAYLTFTYLSATNQIQINDSVFSVCYDIPEEMRLNGVEDYSFSILKSDFIVSGNQSFQIHTDEVDKRVIFNGNHVNAIICCLMTKVSTEEISDAFSDTITDTSLDELDIDDILGF